MTFQEVLGAFQGVPGVSISGAFKGVSMASKGISRAFQGIHDGFRGVILRCLEHFRVVLEGLRGDFKSLREVPGVPAALQRAFVAI